MDPAYQSLLQKVDTFSGGVHRAREADMRCAPGCAACCQVSLTVCEVEADAIREGIVSLDDEARERLLTRARAPEGPDCVMLEDGRCGVYAHRPLVCRTQGLPLAYPADVVPVEAVRARDAQGRGVVWCPLNFEAAPPEATEVLDAGRVDEMLALVDRLRAQAEGRPPAERVSLRALVTAVVVEPDGSAMVPSRVR